MTLSVKPFEIEISSQRIEQLRSRLMQTRWPEKECVDDWSQGVPLDTAKEFVRYWLEEYNWYECQDTLNRLPQFTTKINGLEIHFIHVKSSHSDAQPLLLTHGWPGSVIEFIDVIGPLTQPEAFGNPKAKAFHLVIPSLPGFGFSDKPCSTGWGMEAIANAWIQLMESLGYGNFIAQGGDWGAGVTSWIGKINPESLRAIHLNLVVPIPDGDPGGFTPEEQKIVQDLQFYLDWDSGYSKQQSTRPQTLGYGLVDSPVAQAMWILEKFYYWTDRKPDEVFVPSLTKIIDNSMIYWLQGNGASSARLYWESFSELFDSSEVSAPTGVSIFPKEIIRSSKRWANKRYTDIRYWNETKKGGHFAAFEVPLLFVNEIRSFEQSLSKALS